MAGKNRSSFFHNLSRPTFQMKGRVFRDDLRLVTVNADLSPRAEPLLKDLFLFLRAFRVHSAAWKPILLWLPSQKGLVEEAPQRHNAIFARPSVGTFVPAVS
jgi:hypothetical protein